MKSDIIVGLQHGDEGKGKVVLSLINDKYDYCLRFNGGPNAGHTVYVKGNKIVLHQIPCGILNNITSIIGSGCVVDLQKLKDEIDILTKHGVNVESLLKISHNAHVISEEHIQDDINDNPIGSTKSGIRPVNRDKYDRKGIRISNVNKEILKSYIGDCGIVDPYELFHNSHQKKVRVLCEGAQGFELDIDYGQYPYVTSTHCISGFVNSSGVPINSVNKVYGIAKIYATYVGSMEFEDKNEKSFNKLRELGEEQGATTGRDRQINWLNIERLRKSVIINSVSDLIINKCDIIEQLGVFKLIDNNNILEFLTFDDMKKHIVSRLKDIIKPKKIIFSGNKNGI